MTMTDPTDLQAQRARLALDVAEGVEGAAEALADIEHRINLADLEAEHLKLADEERARRLAAEADALAEAARAAAQEELRAQARRSATLGDTISSALDQLCTGLGAFRQLDNEMRIVARTARVTLSGYRSDALKARILGEVAKVFPHNHEHVFANPSGESFASMHRRSLGSLLDEPAPADEPGES